MRGLFIPVEKMILVISALVISLIVILVVVKRFNLI